jgi:hypothetical protein
MPGLQGLGLRRDAHADPLTPRRELKKRQKERARQEQKAAKAAAAPAATQKVAAEGSSAAAEAEMDATVRRALSLSCLCPPLSVQDSARLQKSILRAMSLGHLHQSYEHLEHMLSVLFSGLPRAPIQDHQRP